MSGRLAFAESKAARLVHEPVALDKSSLELLEENRAMRLRRLPLLSKTKKQWMADRHLTDICRNRTERAQHWAGTKYEELPRRSSSTLSNSESRTELSSKETYYQSASCSGSSSFLPRCSSGRNPTPKYRTLSLSRLCMRWVQTNCTVAYRHSPVLRHVYLLPS